MKLVQLYLIGVFIMIGILAASTFSQYQQFQSNVKNLSFNLPREITGGMPDPNSSLSDILNQTQPAVFEPATATSTKQFIALDGSFSFDYPSDWQEFQPQGSDLLFSAYKNDAQNPGSPIVYLTVERSTAKDKGEIINQLEENARARQTAVKITRSEIVNGGQTIDTVGLEYQIAKPGTGVLVDYRAGSAIVSARETLYVVTIVSQGNDQMMAAATDKIFDSIKIGDGAPPGKNASSTAPNG